MSGEPGEAPQPPISREMRDIGSLNQAAEKVAGLLGPQPEKTPVNQRTVGDIGSFSEAARKVAGLQQPEVSRDVEKPYNQEQAQKTAEGLVTNYLGLARFVERRFHVDSTAEAPALSADDMSNFADAAEDSGLITKEGADRLRGEVEEYRKTGTWPESNPSPKSQP